MKRLTLILTVIAVIVTAPDVCLANKKVGFDTEDVLLSKAESFIYDNLDSAEYYAGQVFSMTRYRSQRRIYAMNTLARVAFSRMDYVQSKEIFSEILHQTDNQLDLLSAEIWLMKICQRVSDNISFYEYRNSALMRMASIAEERTLLTEQLQSTFVRLENDFRMVSALYYYELEQNGQAAGELSDIILNESFRRDTTRYLLYIYLQGMGVGIDNSNRSENVQSRLRSFDDCLRISSGSRNTKMKAMVTRGVAEMLLYENSLHILYRSERGLLDRLNSSDIIEELLPTHLTLKALQMFLEYDDKYEVIGCYRLLASCYIEREMYEDAIKYLTMALDMLNDNRKFCYPEADVLSLEPYREDNEIVELEWLSSVPLATLPGIMSSIREQMSLAFSGLSNKVASDYNRNVYLELQKTLRLDRRYEARTQLLSRSNAKLFTTLYAVVIGIVFIIFFFLVFDKKIRKRNDEYIAVLQRVMKLCEAILLPLDNKRPAVEELNSVVSEELKNLLGASHVVLTVQHEDVTSCNAMTVPLKVSGENAPEGYMTICYRHHLNNDGRTILNAVVPYLATAIRNARELMGQEEYRRQIIKQHYLYQFHADNNKRENINRKTCCLVIQECTPFIDRMRSEIAHLKNNAKDVADYSGRLTYISELAQRINEYNELLSDWIKVRKGLVQLNIESFALQPLFDIVNRGRGGYRMKGITLKVEPSDAVVRADKVLTLFMINTLTDNAGKFTPRGGSITISAVQSADYVEIFVSDTGVGLSPEDVYTIENENVYSPESIGEPSSRKGSGFGLMNCKGIIEKYRKTDTVFSVCKLHVESQKGEGSTFSFRLPKGIRRTLSILMLLGVNVSVQSQTNDSLLLSAYDYADKVYQCNIDAKYDSALIYADSAILELNLDYVVNSGSSDLLFLSLLGEYNEEPAETQWLMSGFRTDYETILWLRNEIAVSALALRDWEVYRYNDNTYLKLFKLYYGENLIEQDCRVLQKTNSNLSIAIILFIMLLFIFLITHYVVYSRHWLKYRSDLQQVLSVVNRISESIAITDHFNADEILREISDSIFPEINNLFPVRTVMLAMKEEGQINVGNHTEGELDERLTERVMECFRTGKRLDSSDRLCVSLPLTVVQNDSQQMVGVLGLRLEHVADETCQMLTDMITRYLASALYNCVIRIEMGVRNIEQLKNESERARFEDERLHIRNLILDNCLSTLKHETTYYPNRILQIINSGSPDDDMYELVSYYREIFGILSQYATHQLGESLLRIQTVNVGELIDRARFYFDRNNRSENVEFHAEADNNLNVSGDEVMLDYLLENLLSRSLSYESLQTVLLTVQPDGSFVRFSLYNRGVQMMTSELDSIFYPLSNRDNMSYPICRQIIREHDDSAGHPGCRIVAEKTSDGFVIWFTILKK